MDIIVPDCADDEWMREQFRALRERIESINEADNDDVETIVSECLEVLDALQEYAGY